MSKILKFRKLTIFISLVVVSLGMFAYNVIPKQENPSLNVPFTLVIFEAVGKDSTQIDEEIIMPLRDELLVLDNLDVVESNSYDNYATMMVGFNIGVDNVDELNAEVASIIQSKEYEDVKVTVNNDFEESDILYSFPTDKMAEAQEFVDKLYENEQIKKATISDYTEDYYEIIFDNAMLAQANVSYTDVVSLIGAKGGDYTLGFVEDKSIVTTNNFTDINDLKSLVIGAVQGMPVTVGDIATINLNEDKDYMVTFNDEDSLFISVFFKDSIDITKLSDEIRDISADYPFVSEVSFIPDDVDVAIGEINSNLLLGMGLVLLIVFIGLGFRSAVAIVTTFPLTVFGTMLVLYLLGIELQRVSIAGIIISIGIIVDNAIVIIDSIKHELDLGNDMNLSVKNTIQKNSYPILTSTLTTIFAFSPLLFLPGVAGQMASSLPLTVIIALIISYLSSIFIMPIIASWIIKPDKVKESSKIGNILRTVMKKEKTVIITVIVMLFASVFALIKFQPVQLFPTAEKDFVYVDFSISKSNNLEDVNEVADQIIAKIDGKNVVKAINYTVPSFYNTMEPNLKKPNSGRILFKYDGDVSAYVKELKTTLDEELGDDIGYSVDELVMNQPGAPIVIQLQSIEKTDDVIKDIEQIDGVSEVTTLKGEETNGYDMEFKSAYLLQNQIQEYQVIQQVAALVNSQKLEILEIENVDTNLVAKTNVESIDQLKNQSIVINGQSHAINNLVTFKEVTNPLVISRNNFNLNQEISVYLEPNASVYGINDQVEDVLNKYETEFEIDGEVALTQDVFLNVLYAAIVAVVLIFIVLLVQFQSFKKVAIILSSIPISFIGSAIFLILFDEPITFTATLGLVSLAGVVVNNGIILLDYIEGHEESDLFERCYQSVMRRSRPIIISNVTTIIGLVPLIVFGNDFFRPMAIAMVGGLLVAIPLSLIVIPVMYIMLYRKSSNK